MNNMKIFLIFALLPCLLATLCFGSCSGNGENEETIPKTDGEPTAEATLEITTEAAATTAAEPVTITLRVGTYNIKHGAQANLSMSVIGNIIKRAELDIVGVQEVDYLTNRSNTQDEPALLAKAAGMPYYRFTRAIDHDGGQYGTLILSKFPITEFTVYPLESGTFEGRAVGHAVLDINGVSVDFFNTHLTNNDSATRLGQFGQLAALIKDSGCYILTADFNTEDFTVFEQLGAALMINRADSRHITAPGSSTAIDNIVLSDGWREISAGTVEESYSDHRMLWAELELTVIPD